MRLQKLGLIMILLVSALIISSLPATHVVASSTFECTGLIAAADVVDANVVVPDGAHCGIDGVVNGNIYVSPDGSLTVGFIGTVNGNIRSDSVAATSFLGVAVDVFGTVDGNVTQRGDGLLSVVAGSVSGNVTNHGDGRLLVSAIGSITTIGGNLVNNGSGETDLWSGIGGTLTVEGHVKAKGNGGGLVTDEFFGPGTTHIGKSVCGMTIANVHGASSIGGKIRDKCSSRK